MAIGNTLIFDGLAWPATRIVSSAPMVFKTYPHAVDDKPPSRTIFTLAASGRGRRWSTTRPQGFWRDFVELDLTDAEAVTAFVHRRGDPEGVLDASTETHTGHWLNLQTLLRTAAQAWEPEDAARISSLTADPGRLEYANFFVRDSDFPIFKDLEPVLDPAGRFTFRARTLAAFMAVSAASALERRITFRRCDHCRSWFEFNRKDARFCSGSCRTFHSKQKEKS